MVTRLDNPTLHPEGPPSSQNLPPSSGSPGSDNALHNAGNVHAADHPRGMALPVFNPDFMAAAHRASVDEILHGAMENAAVKKDYGRRDILHELPDPNGLRALAGRIKAHALDHLDFYLEQLEANVVKNGGQVHYAATAKEANDLIVEIAKKNHCKLAVKSKSMVSEETELNHALIAAGIDTVETDLGELIVQIANDHPSHLVMPIVHMRVKQIGEVMAKFFNVPFTDDPQAIAEMARVYLRARFEKADLGISGVNFAVAETGSICLCTNEGNARMCTSRPRVHVALMGMEKMIPRFQDLPVFLKLLARSATTQSLTQYTNIVTGPRREGELDGPEEFHLVIMDNGRTRILASDYRDTLRCIRCGACLNACPIYRSVGGHTYGSIYPGPIGALITPLFNGLEHHEHLPQASSLCGACYEACPVKINIPEMLIMMKADLKTVGKTPWYEKFIFRLWTIGLSSLPAYVFGQKAQRFAMRHLMKSKDGWITKMPGPAKGWTQMRDFPKPPAKTFRELWDEREEAKRKRSVKTQGGA
jgi:L-lactate dehydrogenase complex protein LldF